MSTPTADEPAGDEGVVASQPAPQMVTVYHPVGVMQLMNAIGKGQVTLVATTRFRQVNEAAPGASNRVRIQQLWYDKEMRVGEWRDIESVESFGFGTIPNPAPFYG